MKKAIFYIIFYAVYTILCGSFSMAGETTDAPVQVDQPVMQDDGVFLQGSDEPGAVDSNAGTAGQETPVADDPTEDPCEYTDPPDDRQVISDPLEPMNRVFFVFNDKLYFWLLRPVGSAYKTVAPEPVRIGIKNFFRNILFPVRFVNLVFQAKLKNAGNEVGRLLINSTIGLAGFIDVADKGFGIKESEADFGRTLAYYGWEQGVYINWPFLGPSTTTDSIGMAGDLALDPASYFLTLRQEVAEKAVKTVNNTSLSDDYPNLKEAALDPYIAIRDAYIQYRQSLSKADKK